MWINSKTDPVTNDDGRKLSKVDLLHLIPSKMMLFDESQADEHSIKSWISNLKLNDVVDVFVSKSPTRRVPCTMVG